MFSALAEPSERQVTRDFRELFATHGSRLPGAPGNLFLEKHVTKVFAESGFPSGAMTFEAPAFIPGRAAIRAGDQSFPIQTLHPSMMRPGNFPERKFNTRLIYFGKADYAAIERLRGVVLRGSVALVEFDCDMDWVYLLRFGVKGFIFIGKESYFHQDSVSKLYNTEVSCPRYFIEPEAGARLRQLATAAGKNGADVVIESEPSRWRRQTLHNPWVVIPGSDPELGKDVIVLTAPLDARCIVPERALGIQGAGNLYLLLQLLEHFKENPPARTVVLAAVNAHTQRYKGERILAWFLCAPEAAVARTRNLIARDQREAELYVRNYSELDLAPIPPGTTHIHAGMDMLWELLRLQEERREEAGETEAEAGATDSNLAALELKSFSDADYRKAVAAVATNYADQRGGFLWHVSTNQEAKDSLIDLEDEAADLKTWDIGKLRGLAEKLHPAFENERVFELWRGLLDDSTGFRIPVKKPLQSEATRQLNRLKLKLMDLETPVVGRLVMEEYNTRLAGRSEAEIAELLAALPERLQALAPETAEQPLSTREQRLYDTALRHYNRKKKRLEQMQAEYKETFDEERAKVLIKRLSKAEQAEMKELSADARMKAARDLHKERRRFLLVSMLYMVDCMATQQQLKEQRPHYSVVLKLFNKIDLGLGSTKVRYRHVAESPEKLAILKGNLERTLELYKLRAKYKKRTLEQDEANDKLREALGTKRVALVINLDLNFQSDRFGFCSSWGKIKPGWQRQFGKVSFQVSEALTAERKADRNPFVNTLTNIGSRPEEFYFYDPTHSAVVFQGSNRTPAVVLKNVHAPAGAVFSPVDDLDGLNAARVKAAVAWLPAYFSALLANRDVTNRETGLTPPKPHQGVACWSSVIRTYTLDEFAASATPNEPVPNSLLVLYPAGPEVNATDVIRDGDVAASYWEISDVTGQAYLHAVDYMELLTPAAYQMDESFTRVLFTIDKGLAQSSGQNISNINRNPSKTLAMFKCREFPVYDRIDPTRLKSSPVTCQEYWPISLTMKDTPQRFGVHGAATRGPAASQPSWGPVAVYLHRREKGLKPDPVLILVPGLDKTLPRSLLNATTARPEGSGFELPEDIAPDFFAQTAFDMDRLNRFRLESMTGVSNQLLEDFLTQGKEELTALQRRKQANDHTGAVRQTYLALGNEVKAYTQIRLTTRDMLKAIIFYMALMLPFCFFLQKLTLKLVKLEHQVLAFSGLFISIYVLFRFIHPAFRIALNAEAIFIAFVLGAIGVFVTWIMHSRFEAEMQLILHGAGDHESDVSYSTVGQTALLIGVNNMKRRRIRTTLTSATIVLVTFAMLAFSSISKKMSPTVINRGTTSPYTGFFFFWPGYKTMDEATVRVFQMFFGNRATVSARRTGMPPKGSEDSVFPWELTVAGVSGSRLDTQAFVGLPMSDEKLVAETIVSGRFFSSPTAREGLLSVSACETLGITPAQVKAGEVVLRFLGHDLKLVGMVDDEDLRRLRDLSPYHTLLPPKRQGGQGFAVAGGAAEAEADEDTSALAVDPNAVVLLPIELSRSLGGRPYSVSVRFHEDEVGRTDVDIWAEMNKLLTVTTAKFYVGSKLPFTVTGSSVERQAGVYFVGSSYRTSIGGLSRLIIPLLIAGSIILNTMLGTVYERKAEIAVYNAIGLNPTHIFMFFLGEAFVYAVLGSVGGYIIGQTLSMAAKYFGVASDVTINFSSLMVVYSILFTIALVLLSTLYPAYVATRAAVPSGKRKWSLPDHENDRMNVVFPFIYQPQLAIGVMFYLYQFLERFTEKSIGEMIADLEAVEELKDDAGRVAYRVVYHIALAPFDLGVTQKVVFTDSFDEVVQSYRIRMEIIRVSGQDSNWTTTNKPFLEQLRKRLIRWRNLDPTQHRWYVKQAEALFAGRALPDEPMPAAAATSYVGQGSEETADTDGPETGPTPFGESNVQK